MINLLNKINFKIINGGSNYVCQLKNLAILDSAIYSSDEKAAKFCCTVNNGLKWWNKGSGLCSDYNAKMQAIAEMEALKLADKEREVGCFSHHPKIMEAMPIATSEVIK